MKLKPYSEYKDTGIPWIDMIPSHWACLPNRAIFREIKSQGHVDEPLLSVTIGRGVIRQADLLADTSKKDSSNLDKSKYKLVTYGDIAYNKMRAWQGAIGVSRYRGIVSPAYIVVRPRPSHKPEYFHFLMRTPAFATEAERWSYGITSDQWSLRPEHFKMIYCCVPPPEEQDLIVSFLRQVDRSISRFIHNKRRLIELLHQQKQVIINSAVTRGLNPDFRLKSSGIEWLGDVPEHWEVVPIKRAFSIMRYGTSKSAGDEGEFRVLTMGNIKDGDVHVRNCGRIDSVASELILEEGDLLFNRTNSQELVGKVGLFKGTRYDKVTIASYLVLMRVNDNAISEYMNYLLNSPDVLSFARQNAVPSLHQSNLNPTRYGRLLIPLPGKGEQELILKYIEENFIILNSTISHAQRQIDLIREYRTRLIADVVTGKVDVRAIPVEAIPEEESLEEFVQSEEIEEALDIEEAQHAND